MYAGENNHCIVCGKEVQSGTLCHQHRAKQFTGELNAPPKPEPQHQETIHDIMDGYYGVYPFYWSED